ncbi:MAG: AbrB/MazE/SpoVT family DNA-binding domain-containing protein [Clostridia bacterium]|nr:AbrB/MazE/SpoVT family DNA-binding domain-containing protein [Clostridia bacterium]
MKKVDKLGRIVIPIELRQKYGLNEGTKIEFIGIGEGIMVRSDEPFCKICHEKIPEDNEFPLCEKCMAEVIKSYQEKR